MPTKEENAYFAGMVDGEGSVSVIGSLETDRKHHYFPRAIITNNHKGVCDIAKELYGGCVYQRKDMEGRTSPCYNWVITSRLADKFLRLVLPYLIIKKEQAKLVLTFYEDIYVFNGKNLSQEIRDEMAFRREELIKKIKLLNRR